MTMWLNNNKIVFISSSAFNAVNRAVAFLNIEDIFCYHRRSVRTLTTFNTIIKDSTCINQNSRKQTVNVKENFEGIEKSMDKENLIISENLCANLQIKNYTEAIDKFKYEILATLEKNDQFENASSKIDKDKCIDESIKCKEIRCY